MPPAKVQVSTAVQMVPVDQLKHYGHAPRHESFVVDRLARAICENGIQKPLLINGQYEVIIGSARLQACKQAGLAFVPCFDGSHISPEKQKALNAADRKIGELAHWQGIDAQIVDSEISVFPDYDPSDLQLTAKEMEDLVFGWQAKDEADAAARDEGPVVLQVSVLCPQSSKQSVAAAMQVFLAKQGLVDVVVR